MKIIYLIRHGKPYFPGDERMCIGKTDLPLSQEGLLQAQAAAEILAEKEFTVYSSPLLRARQTAAALHRPVRILEGISEMDAGVWDGLTFREIRQRFPELCRLRAEDKTVPLPEAESNEAALMRFKAAVSQAISETKGDLAIVGHGGIMALFLQAVLGTWEKPGYGEIISLAFENGCYQKLEDSNYA